MSVSCKENWWEVGWDQVCQSAAKRIDGRWAGDQVCLSTG